MDSLAKVSEDITKLKAHISSTNSKASNYVIDNVAKARVIKDAGLNSIILSHIHANRKTTRSQHVRNVVDRAKLSSSTDLQHDYEETQIFGDFQVRS